jgi:hypothetical protein
LRDAAPRMGTLFPRSDCASMKKRKKKLRPGDRVAWQTSQGKTKGRVVKKQTKHTRIKGHKVAASKDNPEYIVESKKSGKRAAHKRDALTRVIGRI